MQYWNVVAIMVGFCVGFRAITDDGKILYPLRRWAIDRYTDNTRYILEPLIICCTCMASIWGSIIFWGLYLINNNITTAMQFAYCFKVSDVFIWIISCTTTAYFNSLLWSIYDYIKRK